MASLPLSLRTYRFATSLLEPAAPLLLNRRARRGKESVLRLSERLGHASRARPEGTLIWIHAVSVGECLAVLPLIEALLAVPGRNVLLTSGTVTSAKLMEERLPQRTLHQFAPVDTPGAVGRFLDHWRPDVGIFVDSEVWPNMLLSARAKGVRLAVVNGRMTERSFAGWTRAQGAAASLFGLYEAVLVQDKEAAERFAKLGARNVVVTGNLKADAPALPVEPDALAELQRQIGARPIFLATNTHAGEDGIILEAFDRLRREFPDLLAIIAPRHAERGPELAQLSGKRGHASRSPGEKVDDGVSIYIVDTMGELGLFYRLASFAFVGKSLVAGGGQNPLEPARLGVAVLAGPHTENFREAYETIFAAQGLGRVASVDDLVGLAAQMLRAPSEARRIGAAALEAVAKLSGALARTHEAVERLLKTHA